jgi:ribosomal protein S27AE
MSSSERVPCTYNCMGERPGAQCPKCGHNSFIHPGPANVPCCPQCELEILRDSMQKQSRAKVDRYYHVHPFTDVMLRCSECGAIVANPARHDRWHDREEW